MDVIGIAPSNYAFFSFLFAGEAGPPNITVGFKGREGPGRGRGSLAFHFDISRGDE